MKVELKSNTPKPKLVGAVASMGHCYYQKIGNDVWWVNIQNPEKSLKLISTNTIEKLLAEDWGLKPIYEGDQITITF